jgi:hypothetical protein
MQKERCKMATMTMEAETKTVAAASLDDRIDDLLDQLEFQRRLKISLGEADRGEDMPAEEAFDEIARRLKTGYYR